MDSILNVSKSMDNSISMISQSISAKDSLDLSGKMLDRFFAADDSFPTLIEKMQITKSSQSVSGCTEYDYPKEGLGMPSITPLKSRHKIPLPAALIEQWNDAQNFHRKLGIFPSINRVWVTVDQEFFLWDYSEGTDLSYFDGMNSTIFAVALVPPKPNVFQAHIKHLLVLATGLNIAILGVTFKKVTSIDGKTVEQLELTTDTIYEVPTEGVITSKIVGTDNGRIFLASEDGNLFEIDYWKDLGWFSIGNGRRCKKVCHSTGTLSYILPSFLTYAITEPSAIIDVAVDNTRHILYTLSENSSIEMYDLGSDGKSTSRIVSLSHSNLEHQVSKLLRTIEIAQMTILSCIKIVEETESPNIHVLVVSKSGFRLYFSTGAITSSNTRPYTLQLVHIRLPPGYNRVIGESKPSSVQHVLYNRGTIIMACNTDITNYRPMLWCISSDEYAFSSNFSERYFITDLDVCPLSLENVGPNLLIYNDPSSPQPPLIVRQQFENRQEYITLAPQGLEIFEMLRPYDTLCELLASSQGSETDAIKTYFKNFTDNQACVACLTIICDQSLKNIKIKEYATRAFFTHGGEPKLVTENVHELTRVPQSNSFRPDNLSLTMPTFITNQTNITHLPFESTSVQYSSKHNGLYLFVSRLLRPLWNIKAVNMETTDGKNYIVNTVSPDDCSFVASHLQTLHSFMNNYSKMLANYTRIPFDASKRTATQDAHQSESKSIECLKQLVVRSAEVFNLWKLLSEHQFNVIVKGLMDQEQRVLENITFKELILVHQELCQTLVQKLLDTYLNESSSVESISTKLRQVCPSIYHSEDAACAKASEMIKLAQSRVNEDERKRILYQSLMVLKEVAPKFNLTSVCLQYTNCAYMEGVYQICKECAKKIDPKNLGGHYFVNNMVLDRDGPGYGAYMLRLDIYKEINASLDYLYSIMVKNPSVFIPTRPNLIPGILENSALTSEQSSNLVSELIKLCLSCDDEIMHTIVYKWMIDKKLIKETIEMGHHSLEKFLLAQSRSNENNNYIKDVLCRYYEYNGNYNEAAEVLASLAKRPECGLTLSDRLMYLGRAMACLRSKKLSTPALNVTSLRDVEDMLQVAEIQKMILDLLLSSQIDGKADIIEKLNSCLFTLGELYSNFAEPHSLWEAQLAILQLSNHDDRELINQIWENILLKVVEDCGDIDEHNKMTIALEKIKSLASSHPINSSTFDLEYVTTMLEYLNCNLGGDLESVYTTMLTIGAPIESLVAIYKKIYSTNDPRWQKTSELHVLEVIMSLARYYLQNIDLWPSGVQRRSIAANLFDLLVICLNMLYSRFAQSSLIEGVIAIQNELDNIIKN
ncbi:PREDICTED: nuclear pore complex protein Nup155-like [Diuraphis noxia]|uniref:nuclear pore complex protein Nup155-like n=1 Tax=Diuraphis noxia TaxID=143948 RepID=UPI000763A403|nr:PREDICTED: nuclear pore complex protein Nup155-like [Diuraphis noxia]XP_015372251.1 PREDICTED: nuclear pore complex protein Nup155-like [Diuraphis noxia]